MPEPAPVTNLQPTLSDALFPPVRRADVPTVKKCGTCGNVKCLGPDGGLFVEAAGRGGDE